MSIIFLNQTNFGNVSCVACVHQFKCNSEEVQIWSILSKLNLYHLSTEFSANTVVEVHKYFNVKSQSLCLFHRYGFYTKTSEYFSFECTFI